jgi:hypothetical protein
MSEDAAKYVAVNDCIKHVTEIENKLTTIQTAICGSDMRGGLVKDINKLYVEVALLKKAVSNGVVQRDWSKKQWLGIVAAITTSLISVAGNIIVAMV